MGATFCSTWRGRLKPLPSRPTWHDNYTRHSLAFSHNQRFLAPKQCFTRAYTRVRISALLPCHLPCYQHHALSGSVCSSPVDASESQALFTS